MVQVSYKLQITVATVYAVAALCLAACKADEVNLRSGFDLAGVGDNTANSGNPTPTPTAPPKKDVSPEDSLKLLSEPEAMAFLESNCKTCHGLNDEGIPGPNFSAWPMTAGELSIEAFEVSFFAPIVYQAIANKLLDNPPPFPQPMPYGGSKAEGEQARQIMQVLAWFQVNLPLVVAEAEDIYGVSVDKTVAAEVAFECSDPVNLRVFLNRLTNTIFDRPPTVDELMLFQPGELDAPVTLVQRQFLVARIWTEASWTAEFEQVGLLKIARAIGGAPALAPVGELTENQIQDLKSEFYRALLSSYRNTDYRDLFNANTVYVTSRTASLYYCKFHLLEPIEGDTTWRICEMRLPRSGFFTTIGYLASRPQSFLQESNNYGRVATMYFTLAGEGFRAAVNGPAGSGAVNPLPHCLETKDNRAVTGAPRGSAAVPQFGNNCQGCHISRNLAGGSVLFRDFSPDGQIYTSDNLESISPELLEEATTEEWTFVNDGETEQVDKDFLQSLLSSDKKACSVSLNPAEQPKIHQTVNDLANYLMSNKKRLARGFMRHAQRAFLNSETINFDLVYGAVKRVDEEPVVTVKDLVNLYLESETFACKAK